MTHPRLRVKEEKREAPLLGVQELIIIETDEPLSRLVSISVVNKEIGPARLTRRELLEYAKHFVYQYNTVTLPALMALDMELEGMKE